MSSLDKVLTNAVAEVSGSCNGHFLKSEILRYMTENTKLAGLLDAIRKLSGNWKLDQAIIKHINNQIGRSLQKRDADGLRVYECYAIGQGQRRWMRLGAMSRQTLILVMQETRTQERQLHRKGEGYHLLIEALERAGGNATVDDVRDEVIAELRRFRSDAA